MRWLCGVKGLHRFQLSQPVIDIAFQDSGLLALIFRLPLSVNNQQRPQAQLSRLTNERKHLLTRLLHQHAVQVQTSVDLVLTQSQLSIHAVLNPRPLEFQYMPSIQRHHTVINEWIHLTLFTHCSPLAPFLLVLRETVLDQTHACLTAQGLNPGHFVGKEILVAHPYLHSDRRLGQYSPRICRWGTS